MADFNQAVTFVLDNEGGFSNDEHDEGGATNFGVSLRYLRGLPDESLRKYGIHVPPDVEAVKAMTVTQAKAIYLGEFWQPKLDEISRQPFANYIFDMCVNHGISEGIKILQRAICAAARDQQEVVIDGVLGDGTVNAVTRSCVFLPATLIATRSQFYRQLAEKPGQEKFLKDWLDRAYRFG